MKFTSQFPSKCYYMQNGLWELACEFQLPCNSSIQGCIKSVGNNAKKSHLRNFISTKFHQYETDVYFEAPQKFLLSLVYNFETMPTVTHQTQSSHIHRFPDLKLSWSGDYESLKLFVDSELNLQGKWTSTGGENKLFESDNVDIHWRAKKKFLRIEGKQLNAHF